MKGAAKCAQKVKTLFSRLRRKLGKVAPPPPSDGVTQLILGVLSRDIPEPKAREALDRLRGAVVDYNELRVIPAIEMVAIIGDLPDVRLKCEDLVRALNRIFAFEHSVTLDRVQQLPRKEMVAFLEQIDGLEPYTRARIRLLAFAAPAVPLDTAMWACARKEGVVDAEAPLDEAQAFLERTIAAADSLEFFTLFRKHAWAELGTAVRRGAVERVSSVPPDRTIRNMLRQVASGDLNTIPVGASGGPAAKEKAAAAPPAEADEAPPARAAKAAKSARAAKTSDRAKSKGDAKSDAKPARKAAPRKSAGKSGAAKSR